MTSPDLPILERARVRELDRVASDEFGLPGVVLMENAGRGAAQAILRAFAAGSGELGTKLAAAVILCGAGNNGGDGYVVARHLHEAGVLVTLLESAPPEALAADAAVFRRVCAALGIECRQVADGEALTEACRELEPPQLFVDALLGTGFQGALRETTAELLRAAAARVAQWGAAVVALDTPSGFDVDTGAADPACLRAALTLTFAADKPALARAANQAWTGRVEVIPIGLPSAVYERIL